MTDSSSLTDLKGLLDSIEGLMSDRIPSTRAFVEALKIREKARGKNGHPGNTSATLVADLITILSSFEIRLNALETGNPPPSGLNNAQNVGWMIHHPEE